jgi:8-oxo-dGTP diphosphatase
VNSSPEQSAQAPPAPRIGRFLAGIGALLRRSSDGRYLFLRRSLSKDYAAGDWECVTGRVDQGEGFTEAVHREICEEVGLRARIEFIIGTTHFYRGETAPENELLGVLYCCAVENPQPLRISSEHSEYRWLDATELDALLPADHWLIPVVARVETMLALTPVPLLDYYRTAGFDID